VDWSAAFKKVVKIFAVLLSVINFLFFALNIFLTTNAFLNRSFFEETIVTITFFISIFAMLFSVIPAVFVRHWINWTVFVLNILIFIIQQIFLFHNYSY
jgi:hypothetical protein